MPRKRNNEDHLMKYNWLDKRDAARYGFNTLGQYFNEHVLTQPATIPAGDNYAQANAIISKALLEESANRKNKKVKAYYEGIANIMDSSKGNILRTINKNFYLSDLLQIDQYLLDPKNKSDEERFKAGIPFFDAVYDLKNAIVGEVLAHYDIYDAVEKKNLLARENSREQLKNQHIKLIKACEKLNSFPESNRNYSNLRNTLDEVLGRTNDQAMDANLYVGFARGELQALEKGWGVDDMRILGAIGAIEEGIKKYEAEYSTSKNAEQDDITRFKIFKADFYELKSKCYTTYSSSTEAKKYVARAMKKFINDYPEDNEIANKCMTAINPKFYSLNGAVNALVSDDELAVKNNSPYALDEKDIKNPDVYLAKLWGQVKQNGNIGDYAAKLCWLEGKSAKISIDGQVDTYLNTIGLGTESNLNSQDILKIQKEIAKNLIDSGIAFGQLVEANAELMRNSPDYAPNENCESLCVDYKLSKLIARETLKGKDVYQTLAGAKKAAQVLDEMNPANREELQRFAKEYMETKQCGLSGEEKVRIFKEAINDSPIDLRDYGIERSKDTILKVTNSNACIEQMNSNMQEINSYTIKITELKEAAKRKLNELKVLKDAKKTAKWDEDNDVYIDRDNREISLLKANSPAFMYMYDSLRAITKLKNDSSPAKILSTLKAAQTASEGYQKKIQGQWFAGKSKNGQDRLNFAEEFKTFAKQNEANFKIPEDSSIDLNKPISEQMTNAAEALTNFSAKHNFADVVPKAAKGKPVL
ncbi:hypothetical protein SAMN02910298_02569 [Pseudobutyrivibrio sp. YE44]|nr:hypothetical protein SAMN02910298_02569 [Pseudobutyrivibrio sp. YE44]